MLFSLKQEALASVGGGTFTAYKAKNPAGGIKLKYLINARQNIKNVVDTEIVPLLNF